MADNFLITGYWGEPHVTAENDRGINAAMFGTGRFVLPVGKQFEAEYIGNNTVRMYDGKLMNNGAAAGIPAGEFIDLLIANAGQGMNRNDLIIFQYSQDSSTLIESGTFVVIQGEETADTATDPTLTKQDLLSGMATFDQMALWRVCVSEASIVSVEKVFTMFKASGATSERLTVSADSWTGDEAPYTATVASTLATADNHLVVGAGGAVTVYEQTAMAAAMIICTGQATGSITLSAFGEKPTIALPVNIICVG